MPNLKAVAFRIQNFRNIDDSEWIPIERVTALVGRNESGKTALLKALHKFNPASNQPYIPQREFPRDRYTRDFKDGSKWPVSSVKFEIEQELQKTLESITAPNQAPRTAVVTRFYDGHLKFEFDPAIAETTVAASDVVKEIDAFTDSVMRLAAPAPEKEAEYTPIRKELLDWTTTAKARIATHQNLKTAAGHAVLQTVHDEIKGKGRPETADVIQKFVAALAKPLNATSVAPASARVEAEIQKCLPIFIYFDNYGVLDSAIYLPRLLEDLVRAPNDPKVRTINAMFKHVQLTAQEVAELGQSKTLETHIRAQAGQKVDQTPEQKEEILRQDQEKMELRSIKLNSASNDITTRFSAWWKQRRHTIRYHADGDFFRIWIADDRRPNIEIELESRSAGFQWFFSFYITFLVESEEMHKQAILLLDEPGLHLHPTAQQELIAFFETLSSNNQLIYSTHSPFLIDGEHLHRVRPVTESEDGHSRISIGGWPKDRETIFPLQAAAGYAMVRGLFQHHLNLLVEGISEYFYLHILSIICRALGRAALPEDIYITPCGGTPMVGKIAALFLGQEVRPIILLDGDQAAYVQRNNLTKELYVGQDDQIVMLDELLGITNCEIEDVVGEEVILPALNELLAAPLTIDPADRTVTGVVNQIRAAAKRAGIELPEGWKPEIARRIAAQWAADAKTVPSQTLDRAATLFADIAKRIRPK